MKLAMGYGPEIYGTIEVAPDGVHLIYEGAEILAMENLIEDLSRKFPHAKDNLEAYLQWLPTRLRGRTWARMYGDRPEEDDDQPESEQKQRAIVVQKRQVRLPRLRESWLDQDANNQDATEHSPTPFRLTY